MSSKGGKSSEELFQKYAKRRIAIIMDARKERSQLKKFLRDDGFHDIVEFERFDEAWEKLKLSTTFILIFSTQTQTGVDFLEDLIESTRFKRTALLIFTNRLTQHVKLFANAEITACWEEAPINSLKVEQTLVKALEKGIAERNQIADESAALDHFTRAVSAIEDERYGDAKELLRKALKENPDFFEAYVKMAETLTALGEFEAAKRVARRALELQPNHPMALRACCQIFAEAEPKEAAIKAFDYAVEKRPRDALHIIEIGNIALKKGWVDEAIGYFEMAREIDPNLIHVYNRLGIAHSRAGAYDTAMKMYELALGIDGEDAGVHFNIGMAYYRQGAGDKALEFFTKANQLDPSLAEPLEWMEKIKGAQ